MSGIDLWQARKAVRDAAEASPAPAADRVYFPVRRAPRVTPPPPGAPTLVEIVQWYWDEIDNESPQPNP